MVVVYNIDRYGSLAQAESVQRPEPLNMKRRKREQGTYTLTLDFLEMYGTSLGHLDVTNNLSMQLSGLIACEECGNEHQLHDLRGCDGCYPTNVGLSFPQGAMGRQHACHRGAVCTSCSSKTKKKARESMEP